MYSRFFNIAVYLMWFSTMTWLITQKVAPSFWIGQPPSYQTILDAQRLHAQVGWTTWLNNKQMGWAISSLQWQEQGPKEIHAWVHFEQLPLQELTSGWSRALLRLMDQPPGKLTMNFRSVFTIDTLGKLLRFDSRVQIVPSRNVLHLRGIVDKLQLHVEIRSGDFSYSTDVPLPQYALLSDSISPQSQLPNLAKGQTWAVPAVSPLQPTNNMMEILHATVEGKEPIYWNGQVYDAWLVVYRNDPGGSFGSNTSTRGKIWVLEDGTVIRQQTAIFDSQLSFIRMSEEETRGLMKKSEQMGEDTE